MTNNCTIGPLSLTYGHLIDNNAYDSPNTEKFMVICDQTTALQIKGMASPVTVNQYPHVFQAGNDNGWSPIWIDSNISCTDNDTFTHRGWYLIDTVDVDLASYGVQVGVTITAIKIADNINEILTMQCTPGYNDNTVISSGYTDTAAVYSLQETFTSFDTTNVWTATQSSGLGSPSITASGGKLVMSGVASVDGVMGSCWTQGKVVTEAVPWIMDFDMEWVAQPAAGKQHIMYYYVTPNVSNPSLNINESIVVTLSVTNTAVTYSVTFINYLGTMVPIVPTTSFSTSIKVLNWRLYCWPSGWVTIYLDTGSGYVALAGNYPMFRSWTNLLYGYVFRNTSTSSATVKSSFCNIYEYASASPQNVISLPVTTSLGTAADFTRTGEDGAIPCYLNPTNPLTYQIAAADIYKGCVQAWSTNTTAGTPIMVTNTDHVIDPLKFTVDNTLTKLVTTANGVQFYYYASGWVLLNTFTLPSNIKLIKILNITPEQVVIQIDRTIWTMERGKQFVRVQHPTTALGYTLNTCYVHDSTTSTSPGANADITMLTQSYTNIWNKGSGSCASPNPAVNYRLQIIKTNPTTIKSDTIPADTVTGIGWYNNTLASNDNSYYLQLARQFFVQPRQHTGIVGV